MKKILMSLMMVAMCLSLAVYAETTAEAEAAHSEKANSPVPREERMPKSPVISAMNIKPGMEILDIGAGEGYFSFSFTDLVGKSGKVYATEIDPKKVKALQDTAAQNGYQNVIAEKVALKGLDPVYLQHSYDIIFMSYVYNYMHDQENYFKQLMPALKKGGRLFILEPETSSGIMSYQIRDINKIFAVLASREAEFPITRRLNPDVVAYLKGFNTNSQVPDKFKAIILADFQKILKDPTFYKDMSDYFYSKTGSNVALSRRIDAKYLMLANWLVERLDSDGAFKKQFADLSELQRTELRLLNNILLESMFGGGLGQKLTTGNSFIPLYDKKSIIAAMRSAGYKFLISHPVNQTSFFLEFGKGSEKTK